MSKVHQKLKRSDDASESQLWYLKIPGGSIYGPVEVHVLAEWAAQLRIAPGNEVSTDKETWQPAESLKELKMEWMAELPEGKTYGPFNVLAVPYLYKNGTFSANDKLRNIESGKVVFVHELLKSSGVAPAGEGKLEKDSPLSILRKKKEAKWEALYQEEKASRRQLEAKHEKEIGVLAEEIQAARSEIEKIKKESTKRITEQTASDKNRLKGAEDKELALETEIVLLREKHKNDLVLLDQAKARLKDVEHKLEDVEADKERLNKTLEERSEDKLRAERVSVELKETQDRLNNAEMMAKELNVLRSDLAQLEKDKQVVQEKLDKVDGQRLADQKTISDATELVKKAEAEIAALNEVSSSQKLKYAEALRDRDDDLCRLKEEMTRAEQRCKAMSESEQSLRKELETFKTESEAKTSEIVFKYENMKKELQTQKALYAKIEQTDSERDNLLKTEIEKTAKIKDEAEGRVRRLQGEVEQVRKESAKTSADFEEQIRELKAKQEKIKADAVRREEEKAAVTEKLLSTRHDLSAKIEVLTENMKAMEVENKSLKQEIEKVIAGNGGDKSEERIAGLETALHRKEKELSDIEAVSNGRSGELIRKIAILEEETQEYKSRIAELENDLAARSEMLELAGKTENDAVAKVADELEDARRKIETLTQSHSRKVAELEAEIEHVKQNAADDMEKRELDVSKGVLEDEKKAADVIRAQCDRLSSELEVSKAGEAVLNKKLLAVEEQLALTVDKHRNDESVMAEQAAKYSSMLAADRAQMDVLREEAGMMRAEIKSLKEANEVMLDSRDKQRAESSQLNIEKSKLSLEKEQLLAEKATFMDDIKKLRVDVQESGQIQERLASELASRTEGLEKSKASLADMKKAYADLEEKKKATEKEYQSQLKHLKDMSKTSAEVVERLNSQIIDYRDKYQSYEDKIKKLMTELNDKKGEMTELRHSYEPLVKKSQQNEQDLLKKVARLETEKAKLLRPVASLPDRIADMLDRMRLHLNGAEGFFRRYPYLSRNSLIVAVMVLCIFLIFKVAFMHHEDDNRLASVQAEKEDNSRDNMVLSQAQRDIDFKVEAIENAVLAIALEVDMTPKEPEILEIDATAVGSEDAVRAAENMISQEFEDITDEPVAKVKSKVLDESLDLDLSPVASVRSTGSAGDVPGLVKIKWPVIKVAGTRVEYTGQMCKIVFLEGVFPYMTVIKQDAVNVLGEIADQIKGRTADFKMIVEGHCDSVPLSGAASVQSNYVLGMARAQAVVDILQKRFGLPAEFLIPTSKGEKEPPFSNDDPVERKKNRTVVLEIIPN